ncbi:unnamed protein product [Arabidopsis thaliana]|uniref:Uncharacterized protein n=1 Tax=Arabidopsis thaliana TaxID=3702 RepID=Q9LHC5_ARATH|nr:unnamed protein product [Arabidopsis thaliana]
MIVGSSSKIVSDYFLTNIVVRHCIRTLLKIGRYLLRRFPDNVIPDGFPTKYFRWVTDVVVFSDGLLTLLYFPTGYQKSFILRGKHTVDLSALVGRDAGESFLSLKFKTTELSNISITNGCYASMRSPSGVSHSLFLQVFLMMWWKIRVWFCLIMID